MVNRKKILILDPSPIFSNTLKEVIEDIEMHVEVTEVTGTDQAQRVLQRDSLDVVFLDIAIPQENGTKFIAVIRRMAPDARIVVLSSYDSVEYKEASMREGADFFLSKERSGGLRLLDVIQTALRGDECDYGFCSA